MTHPEHPNPTHFLCRRLPRPLTSLIVFLCFAASASPLHFLRRLWLGFDALIVSLYITASPVLLPRRLRLSALNAFEFEAPTLSIPVRQPIVQDYSLANFSLQATGYTLRGPNVGRQSRATTSRHTLCLITVKAEAEVVPLCWSFLNPILNSIAMPISVSSSGGIST
ncbi:uncharacterized protein LOC116006136 isoform X2 [Ipomoea triloba]|uniref:uncharacterized protein LOC116006136 isoform X2 n=1 Tax=Ipomoea triloba TaxID=35885 RepID=UPI00125CF947|nr:uncharacterized protein LOC116006136 isoform X2 [Ipomoea triloba]